MPSESWWNAVSTIASSEPFSGPTSPVLIAETPAQRDWIDGLAVSMGDDPRARYYLANKRIRESEATIAAFGDKEFKAAEEPERRQERWSEIRGEYSLPPSPAPEPSGFWETGKREFTEPLRLAAKVPFVGDIPTWISLSNAKDAIERSVAAQERDESPTVEDLETIAEFKRRAADDARGRKAGGEFAAIVSNIPTFGVEFTTGFGGLIRRGATKAIGEAAKQSATKAIGTMVNQGMRRLGATAIRTPLFTARIGAEAMRDLVPDVGASLGRDDHFELVVNDANVKTPAQAWTDAGFDIFIELVSEQTGGVVGWVVRKTGAGAIIGRATAKLPKQSIGVRSFLRQAGYHGVVGEVAEERIGEGLRWVANQFGTTIPVQAPTIGQIGVETAAFSVPGIVGASLSRAVGSERQAAPTDEQLKRLFSLPEIKEAYGAAGAPSPSTTEEQRKVYDIVLAQRQSQYEQQQQHEAKIALLEDHTSRVAAGQADPMPNADAFEKAGKGRPTRKERPAILETVKQEIENAKVETTKTEPTEAATEIPQTPQGEVAPVLARPLVWVDATFDPKSGEMLSAIHSEALGITLSVRGKKMFQPGATPKGWQITKAEENAIDIALEELRKRGVRARIFSDSEKAIRSRIKRSEDAGHTLERVTGSGNPAHIVLREPVNQALLIRRTQTQTERASADKAKGPQASQGEVGAVLEKQGPPAAETIADVKAQEVQPDVAGQQMMGGVSGAAYAPSRPSGPLPDADVGPSDTFNIPIRPLPMPELVEMARILSGHVPKVLRSMRGKALGRFRPNKIPQIILEGGKRNMRQLAQTLGHEIGHLDDWLGPIKTLLRGNILGRIASLKKYMRGFLIVPGRPALRNKTIRNELIALTEWWSGPFDRKTSYGKYRIRSSELYAEATSVWLLAPRELERRAPEFWKGFTAYLDRKPEVLEAYVVLQDILNGTAESIAKDRWDRTKGMLARSGDVMRQKDAERSASRHSMYWRMKNFLFQGFVNQYNPLGKTGTKEQYRRSKERLRDLRMILDDLEDPESESANVLKQGDRLVMDWLRQKGYGEEIVEAYVLYRRISEGDRGEYANPLGFDPTTSSEQLAYMRTMLGDADFAELQERMLGWHREIVWPLVEEAYEAGLLTDEQYGNAKENMDNYAAFAVAQHYQDGVKAGIYQQHGTFEDIIGPYTAMQMKLIAMRRWINHQKQKVSVGNFLQEFFGDEYREVEVKGKGRMVPGEVPKVGFAWVPFLRNGKRMAMEIDEFIAAGLAPDQMGYLKHMIPLLSHPTYKVFHNLYVTMSIAFHQANLVRDMTRTYVNYGAPGVIKLLVQYAKAMPIAYRRAMGIEDSFINQMEEEGALRLPFVRRGIVPGEYETKLERLLEQYGVKRPPLPTNAIYRQFQRAHNGLMGIGIFVETMGKVAGYKMLEEHTQIGAKERAFLVRNYVSTPSFTKRGVLSPLANSVMMYFRMHYAGLSLDARLATEPQTRSGWWFRRTVATVLPKTLMFLAAAGALGPWLKLWFGLEPDEVKQNSTLVPLGIGKNDKAMGLRMPQDHTGQMLGSLWWHLLNTAYPTDSVETGSRLQRLANDLYGSIIVSPNPILNMAGVWASYAMGVNPRDRFYGRNVLSRLEEQAGGVPAFKKMLWWTLGQAGALSIVAGPVRNLLREKTDESQDGWLEATIETTGLLRPYVTISDRGVSERYWAMIESEEQDDAAFALKWSVDTRWLNQQRFILNRLQDKLNDREHERRMMLNKWSAKVYDPLREWIKAQEAEGFDASDLREELRKSASEMRREIQTVKQREAG